jgi:hypothetical protein
MDPASNDHSRSCAAARAAAENSTRCPSCTAPRTTLGTSRRPGLHSVVPTKCLRPCFRFGAYGTQEQRRGPHTGRRSRLARGQCSRRGAYGTQEQRRGPHVGRHSRLARRQCSRFGAYGTQEQRRGPHVGRRSRLARGQCSRFGAYGTQEQRRGPHTGRHSRLARGQCSSEPRAPAAERRSARLWDAVSEPGTRADARLRAPVAGT